MVICSIYTWFLNCYPRVNSVTESLYIFDAKMFYILNVFVN